ncbi:suppressor of lurcher protein 1-like [Rhipicephalus microplus]|uniref:suppressor of lurcher protein 1-like n=1 Tax=Rhipicephalus microplus TaxID=6941 RepID=UPI003F6B31FA
MTGPRPALPAFLATRGREPHMALLKAAAKKVLWGELLQLLLLLWHQSAQVSPVAGLSAHCRCVTFDDMYGKEYGVFTSPNYPVPYEENIECILFRFIGNADQIVRISFEEFDVQRSNLECVYGDYVKLFLHLDKEEAVNNRSPYNSILCGKINDIEQTHYSSGHALIFEFHSDWRQGNNSGFRGTYRFLSKRQFETDGVSVPDSRCSFIMDSGNRSSGRFFSPQYPSSYPRDIKCAYSFLGRENERVKVLFEQVRLQRGDFSCFNSPDVILVHDGRDGSAPVIGQLCNRNVWVEMMSTGPDLYITFSAQSHFPGRGFMAKYTFSETPYNGTLDQLVSIEPQKTSDGGAFNKQGNGSCDQVIMSNSSKNGTITSPNYPNPYPPSTRCNYHFQGEGKERVQIKFTDFDLYVPHEGIKECENVDSVIGFITIKGQRERLDNFCGSQLPNQIMSNEHRMTVIFQSFGSRPPSVKGFRAIYQFVTNFGIPSGRQDPQGVCTFIYNSSEVSNGTFSTPNYPGVYPRDTECHYLFYGRSNEKIYIEFAYFDVEGVPPCLSDTASDYVEFSNFRTVDRKIPRHCGNLRPTKIESDADFFRVSFKSNDKFDGTGFEAFYQFRNNPDPFTVRQVSAVQNKQNVHRSSPATALLSLVLLWLLVANH